MTLTSGWVEVTQSPFTHEAEGLRIIRELLPDEPPFHAWSNFEFRDGQGKWHEVDLIVLGRRRMHLVELKYYSGTLRGDDHVWRRDGHRAEDSPLKLARRKAQRLASRLAEELRRLARETGVQIPDERDVLPFVQESVFLHHQGLRCQLPTASRQDLFGPDGLEDQTLLPGVSTRLLEPAESSSRRSIDTRRAKIIAKLMAGIGAVQRRQRQAGSWVIDDEPLGEGDDWQDWPAFHQVTQDRKARIRFAITPPGTSDSELTLMRKLAEHEYRTVSALTHEGVLTPIDLVDMELGIGLVYPREEGFQRLDLWMADHREGIPLLTQLSLLRQIGETLAYAHRHRVVHRGLSPSAVLVRPAPNKTMQAVVSNWQLAGRSSTTTSSSASPVTMLGNASQTAVERLAAGTSDTGLSPHAFQAPEGVWARDADRVKLDIFALGALAYYLIAKRPPATTTSSLRERLGRDNGLDLSADVPQVPSVLRELILGATRPQVSERLADVPKFLEGLAKSEEIVSAPDRDDNADPMDALPGALLAGRFRLERRLGSGSTAVGLLVTDLAPESDKTDSRRVLKIAVDDAAADRLAAEAEVLRGLHSPRIVRLIEGPLAVGSRTALLLQFAGDETLADVLSARHTRLSLDLLERYGNDLLDAVVALDAAGVDHRDIKPANLGVSEARGGDRAKHLVLFDFSLTRAAASAVNAGTPGYLDPFLGTGKRTRFDSAAERYAATVVLFEMATGALPVYGDGASDPVSSGAQLRVDSSLFDSAVAASLNKFFTNALGPDVGRRPHTVQEMHAEWRAAFAPVPHTQPDDADELAASAVPTTPLARSGLSARALSAIEPLRVRTVGEFVALDPVRLNRLPGAADATRREVKSRAKEWRDRLGSEVLGRTTQQPADASGLLPDPVAAAHLLTKPMSKSKTSLRRRAAEQILGLAPGLDAFISQTELGTTLGASKQRGPQLIDEMQRIWADYEDCRSLLDALRQTVFEGLRILGGVATVEELTEVVLSVLPGPVESGMERARVGDGLVRVVLDRAAALNRAEALEQPLERRRRRDGRVVAVSIRADLLDAADLVGRRADELVATLEATGEPLIAPRRAADQLRAAFDAAVDPDSGVDATLDDDRLVRLGAARSKDAVVAGDGSLHHRNLSLSEAVRIAMAGLSPTQEIGAQELRDRVRARFPAVPTVPDRSHGLDELIVRAKLPLVYDEAKRVYRSREVRPQTTGLATRVTLPPARAGSSIAEAGGQVAKRLADSIAARSFLALGVPAVHRPRAIELLHQRHAVTVIDVTQTLIETMRRQADSLGLPWATVTASDAAAPGSRDAAGLATLVSRTVPDVHVAIQEAAEAMAGPVLLIDVAPLARYGHLTGLSRWTDLTAARPSAIWLLIVELHGFTGTLIDGKPLPLAAPGQFVQLDDEWLQTISSAGHGSGQKASGAE